MQNHCFALWVCTTCTIYLSDDPLAIKEMEMLAICGSLYYPYSLIVQQYVLLHSSLKYTDTHYFYLSERLPFLFFCFFCYLHHFIPHSHLQKESLSSAKSDKMPLALHPQRKLAQLAHLRAKPRLPNTSQAQPVHRAPALRKVPLTFAYRLFLH